jgi:hypothetical protein
VDLDPHLGLAVVVRSEPRLERGFVREGLDPAGIGNHGRHGAQRITSLTAGAAAGGDARRVAELRPGLAQVTGRVVPAGPPLRAPISGRPCVYYQVIGRNHAWPWHDRLSYPTAEACFWIDDDGAGLWIIVPRSPTSQSSSGVTETGDSIQCSIVSEVVRRTIYAGESPETDRFLEPPAYPFRPDAYVEAEERIVAAGDLLSVGGEVIEEIDPRERSPDLRQPPTRMILRARALRSASAGFSRAPRARAW